MEFEYSEDVETIDLEEIDDFLEDIQTKPSKETSSEKKPSPLSHKLKQSREKADKLNAEIVNTTRSERNSDLPEANLCYRLKNKRKENPITEVDGQWRCPFCRTLVKNINLHFGKNLDCESKIDKVHFLSIFADFTKKKQREKERLKMQNKRTHQKSENKEAHDAMLEKERRRKRDYRAEMILASEETKRELLERKKRDNKNYRDRKKNESDQSYLELLEKNKQGVRNFRERKKNESQKSYFTLMEKNKQDVQNFRDRYKLSVDQVERRRNFSKAVIFGPIFICSCCERMLYESGVTKITAKFKEKLFKQNPKFYCSCIPK